MLKSSVNDVLFKFSSSTMYPSFKDLYVHLTKTSKKLKVFNSFILTTHRYMHCSFNYQSAQLPKDIAPDSLNPQYSILERISRPYVPMLSLKTVRKSPPKKHQSSHIHETFIYTWKNSTFEKQDQ